MYINQYDKTGECAQVGKSAENLFEQWLIRTKKKYRPANLREQYDHIDFVLYTETGKPVSIDVKGPKKISRYDSNKSDDFLWVEFVNVQGYKGSLYGKNDCLAFYKESEKSFYVVKTKELAKLCEQICNQGKVYSAREALYHKYTRSGRKDVISMIRFDDIKQCKYYVIRTR